jgi:shikimate kinase
MNLILCGMQHCGKSTAGQKMAEVLQWTFLDTDHLIEQAYADQAGQQVSCRHIFKKNGESFFRNLEKQQIVELHGISKCVIATGGGAFCDAANRQTLQSLGTIIYLKASPATLWNRIQKHDPPAYLKPDHAETDFQSLLLKRIPFYEQAANLIIDTDGLNHEEVVQQILRGISYGK